LSLRFQLRCVLVGDTEPKELLALHEIQKEDVTEKDVRRGKHRGEQIRIVERTICDVFARREGEPNEHKRKHFFHLLLLLLFLSTFELFCQLNMKEDAAVGLASSLKNYVIIF